MSSPLLDISDLTISFPSPLGDVMVVRNLSLSLDEGTTLGLVGESGCGKTVTAYSILNLVPQPGQVVSGTVHYRGQDLLSLSNDDIRRVRGKKIAMIFQEPMTSLNPVYSIGFQMRESLMLHLDLSKGEADHQAAELLDRVGIPNAMERLSSFPHEFSGGQRQRIMIAMALSTSPDLLIADEPTTALDVTIQAQILELLLDLQQERNMSLLVISHDLGIIAGLADQVAVMYAGEVVEKGSTKQVFEEPRHPYTTGLFDAIPTMGSTKKLSSIPGTVPIIRGPVIGCPFEPRCPRAEEQCKTTVPPLRETGEGHVARCLLV